MGEPVSDQSHVAENEMLEEVLDAVDKRTAHQQLLHNHISDGFMALARERYANPSSSERLGRLVYDNRDDLKSSIKLSVEQSDGQDVATIISRLARPTETDGERAAGGTKSQTLRRRTGAGGGAGVHGKTRSANKAEFLGNNVRNQFIAVPSREVREAMTHFRMAIDQAIEVVNATGRVDMQIQRMT